jgi:2-oxoglutarate ferredoxin oxidoreductase subunit beta
MSVQTAERKKRTLKEYSSTDENAWCPGCGNFGILTALKMALAGLDLDPSQVLLVSGIGQAAKTPHYVKANCFNGLHGRALPVAMGARIAAPGMTIIVTTGDGDCYGEGGNHLIHTIRRNPDITVIVHNNQVYGLTKGQASPTTDPGFRTKVQPKGVILEPIHGLALAVTLGAGFVARGFSGDIRGLTQLIEEGVRYKGFALIEVLQPCVTYNDKNTYQWYKERIYDVSGDGYDPQKRISAVEKCLEWGDRIPTGILYRETGTTFEERSGVEPRQRPVAQCPDIRELIDEYL